MTQIVIKKYKHLIGAIILICFALFINWNYFRKENVYILYNNEVSECQNIDGYTKNRYPLCHNGIYIFEKIKKEPIILIDDIKNVKLTSKSDFFRYTDFSKINIYLVVKKGNIYEVLPVNIFQILS